MNCDRSASLMIDVLYGETEAPETIFHFFDHLQACSPCREEYAELLETRQGLRELAGEEESPGDPIVTRNFGSRWDGRRFWHWSQRIAAAILMVFGAISLFQALGHSSSPGQALDEDQLRMMIHDLVVARQEETLGVIGEALLTIKEELEARDRVTLESVHQDLYSLEERYLQALEENQRRVRALIDE